ncbi:MAG: matrixin family metalloprotease [Myxococcales bacterium]|nr:matrixin family metalloprotease [Myxococcales bacterium]
MISRALRTACSVALLCLTMLFGGTSTQAFVQIKTNTGKTAKWPTLPITWFYNANGFTQIGQSQVVSVMQGAFQQWAAPTCTSFRANYGGTSQSLWSQFDGNNVLVWNSTIPSSQFPTALALTVPNINQQTGDFLDADIIFNSSYQWSTQPTGQQFDVVGTVTHEIGHLLGLDHTPVTDATMFATASPGLCPCRTLKQDDISGVCTIYPGNGNPGTGNVGDTCSAPTDCSSGLTCVLTNSQGTSGVCLSNCTNAGGFCGSGEKCTALTSGGSVCACQSDTDCNNGKTCQNYQCVGGSTTGGNRKLGETCDGQNLCANGLTCVVLQQGSTSGVCFEDCSTTRACPNGETCKDLTNGSAACACQSDGDCSGGKTCTTELRCSNSGDKRKLGEPCDNNILCESGLTCVSTSQGATSGVCLSLCTNGGSCVTGEKCYDLGNGEKACACQNDGDCNNGKSCQSFRCIGGGNQGGQEGEACNPNCATGLNCLNNVCVRPCQSEAQCTGLYKKCETVQGFCIPDAPGTRQRGDVCDAQNLCATGLFCTVLQQGASTGICFPLCVPQSTKPCAGGEPCSALTGRNDGVCFCNQDSDCSGGGSCQQYACKGSTNPGTCTVDTDCQASDICRNTSCVPRNSCQTNNDCAPSLVCTNNICSQPPVEPPPTDGGNQTGNCTPACGAGTYCQKGRCITTPECLQDSDCGPRATCKEYTCVPDPIPESTPPKTGCQAYDTTPLSLFLLLLLAGLALRRKRTSL